MESAFSAIISPTQNEFLPLDDLFGRKAPLELDVGCGKGRFLIARATATPNTNFIGIDRRLKRIQKVNRKIGAAHLTNVRLMCVEACYAISCLLPPLSVSTMYVFFPDPWPKRRHHGRRLFSQSFFDAIHKTLLDNGAIHIATDHMDYLSQIKHLFSIDSRFCEIPALERTEEYRTEFEITFLKLNQPIGRCSFRKIAT
jgi:tRNA (guanine-N7-)-methyltransferase